MRAYSTGESGMRAFTTKHKVHASTEFLTHSD